MARSRPHQHDQAGGLAVLCAAAIISLIQPAFSSQPSSPETGSAENPDMQQPGHRVPHIQAYRVAEDIEGIDGETSAEWVGLHTHLPLLKLAIPATYMSTLTDVNLQRYTGKVEAQDLGVADQLKDGIRLLDVRLWRDSSAAGQSSDWFTEVPWRLYEDAEVLRGLRTAASREPLSQAAAEALEVHSRTNLEESLFKPVLQFLRRSVSEVVIVVFSAVNGNVHTNRNMLEKGSELAESLTQTKRQLEAFLQSGRPYSDNEQENVRPAATEASTAVRVAPQGAYRSPLLHSFVRKDVSYYDYAGITELIDKYWGQLLPRHTDSFLDSTGQPQRMKDSLLYPEDFRQWQKTDGTALLANPISDLQDANIRLILLVDDPLLAWFVTTRSRSQVKAFVKADLMYDVSYKSEAHFAPCGSPHTSIAGKPSASRNSSWPACRTWCLSMGPKECTSWTWKPDLNQQSASSVSKRYESGLGSDWEEKADEVQGECALFTLARPALSFEAVAQAADCSYVDLHSSDLLWDPKAVIVDLERSLLPLVQVRVPSSIRRRSMRRVPEVVLGFDPRLSLLTTGYGGGHEAKYATTQKLIRVLFTPPTPQVHVDAAQRSIHSNPGDAVRRFNSMLAEYLVLLVTTYRAVEKERVRSRGVNVVQISKYNRVRSRLPPFASSSFFELTMILNPSGAISPHLLAFPQANFGYFFEDSDAEGFSKDMALPSDNAHVTIWICFLGTVIALSLCIFVSTFWCSCHPGGIFLKLCRRRGAAGPADAAVEVVGVPSVGFSAPVRPS